MASLPRHDVAIVTRLSRSIGSSRRERRVPSGKDDHPRHRAQEVGCAVGSRNRRAAEDLSPRKKRRIGGRGGIIKIGGKELDAGKQEAGTPPQKPGIL